MSHVTLCIIEYKHDVEMVITLATMKSQLLFAMITAALAQKNEINLSNYFGNVPLCTDTHHLECINRAKSSFNLCSDNNKNCQCYSAGSSIIECSRHCKTLNLNSFYKFKKFCDTNPYILNYDTRLYRLYNSKKQKSQFLINELHQYQTVSSNSTLALLGNSFQIFDQGYMENIPTSFEKSAALEEDTEAEVFDKRTNFFRNAIVESMGSKNTTTPYTEVKQNISQLPKLSSQLNGSLLVDKIENSAAKVGSTVFLLWSMILSLL